MSLSFDHRIHLVIFFQARALFKLVLVLILFISPLLERRTKIWRRLSRVILTGYFYKQFIFKFILSMDATNLLAFLQEYRMLPLKKNFKHLFFLFLCYSSVHTLAQRQFPHSYINPIRMGNDYLWNLHKSGSLFLTCNLCEFFQRLWFHCGTWHCSQIYFKIKHTRLYANANVNEMELMMAINFLFAQAMNFNSVAHAL